MYRNAYQRGLLTIFFSGGANPLNIWDVHTQDGYISRFLDQDIKSMVLEIGGTNVSTSYIICPKGKVVLGITMPFLVMIVKNLKKYFSFEVTILDETLTRRRFRVSNFQSTTQILPLCTAMPIGLSDGWNQIQFNLAEFTRRAYKKQYVEVQKLKINANIRLRRIYFAERLLPEDELPPAYKLYFPLPHKETMSKKTQAIADKESIKPSTSQEKFKTSESVTTAEKIRSEREVKKSTSKTSIYSVKKAASHASRRSTKVNIEVQLEGETVVPEESSERDTEVVQTDEKQPDAVETIEKNNADDGKPAEVTEGNVESATEGTTEFAIETAVEPVGETNTQAVASETIEVAPAEA